AEAGYREGRMRRIGLRFVIAVCYVICPAAGFSQKAPELGKPAGKDWLTIGGGLRNTRHSALTQINRHNIKNLNGARVTHLGSGLGQKYSFEGTPIVKDDVLYIATGNDDVFALDGKTGLHVCREATRRPVFGINECGVLSALARGERFGIIAILENQSLATN